MSTATTTTVPNTATTSQSAWRQAAHAMRRHLEETETKGEAKDSAGHRGDDFVIASLVRTCVGVAPSANVTAEEFLASRTVAQASATDGM